MHKSGEYESMVTTSHNIGFVRDYDIIKEKEIMIIIGIQWKCEGHSQKTNIETS